MSCIGLRELVEYRLLMVGSREQHFFPFIDWLIMTVVVVVVVLYL